jgi:anti-sigma B factor antagonist
MTVTIKRNDTELVVGIEGRLDTLTAPELERNLETALDGVSSLVFDLAELKYISSAGLRVMLTSMQIMEDRGTMKLINVRPEVMDILEVTGFAEDLNIE